MTRTAHVLAVTWVIVATSALAVAGCEGDGEDDVGDGDARVPNTDAADAHAADVGGNGDGAGPSDADAGTDARSDATIEPPDAGSPCAPLAIAGTTVMLSSANADELVATVANASTGTTILLEDGTYRVTGEGEAARRLQFRTAGVTLRSASGDAASVIIDGEYLTNEIINISAADVTIAHVTITHAVDHGIHVTGAAQNVRLYGLHLVDHGEQFIKVNPDGSGSFPDGGRLECSALTLTDDGRPHIERDPGGCYTGGIDAHQARGWTIAQNRFRDIYCAGEGLAEHAIHFWSASRDTLVERNVIENCARGIGFGLVEDGASRPYEDDPYPELGYIGHYDGEIRNNTIWNDIPWYDTGIELAQARGTGVYHNTEYATDRATGFFSSIDYRFANTLVDVRNNLVRRISARNEAMAMLGGNLETSDGTLFVDAAGGDLHLSPSASAAIDQGDGEWVSTDLDGEVRADGAPDIGADER